MVHFGRPARPGFERSGGGGVEPGPGPREPFDRPGGGGGGGGGGRLLMHACYW